MPRIVRGQGPIGYGRKNYWHCCTPATVQTEPALSDHRSGLAGLGAELLPPFIQDALDCGRAGRLHCTNLARIHRIGYWVWVLVQADSEGLCGTSWRCCWPPAWSDATGLYQQMKGCRLHQPTKGYHLRQQTKGCHLRYHQRHLHQPIKGYRPQTKGCRN